MATALADVAGTRRSWTETIHEGLRLVAIACFVANGLSGLAIALTLIEPHSAGQVGLGLLLTGQLLMLAGVVNRRRSGWLTGVVLLTSVGGIALALHDSSWPMGPSTWWPAQFGISLVVFVVYVEPSPRRWGLVALVIGLVSLLRVVTWPTQLSYPDAVLSRQLVSESSQAVLIGLSAYLTISALSTAARRADAAQDAAVARRAAERLAAARATRAREVDRFIHDEVLHTLRTIALDRDAVSADQARDSAVRLGALLAGMPWAGSSKTSRRDASRRGDLTARLRRVASSCPVEVIVTGPQPLSVPPGVENAFARAVEEALRNVARHARTTTARMQTRRSGLTVIVTVSDQGVGFDPNAVDASSRGLTSSVAQRMSDVGGFARVQSRPGGGTVVTLTWSPQVEGSLLSARGTTATGVERMAPAGVTASLPFLLANPWLALWMAPLLTVPAAGWAASLLAVSTGLAATVVGLRHGLRFWQSAVLTAVAWLASLANGITLPHGSTNTAMYWLAGGVSALLFLQVLLRPLQEAVVTGVGLTVVTFACVLRTIEAPFQVHYYLPAIASPALAAACGVLLRRTVDAMGWEVLRSQEAAVEDAASQRLRADFDAELRRRMDRHYGPHEETVLRFVTAVGAGRLDPADPHVQAHADELERAVREELFLLVPANVRQAVRRLGNAGVRVVVRADKQMPASVARETAEALHALAAAGRSVPDTSVPDYGMPGTRVQVTVTPSAALWRVSISVARPPEYPTERRAPRLAEQLPEWARELARDGWTLSEDADGICVVRRLESSAPATSDLR